MEKCVLTINNWDLSFVLRLADIFGFLPVRDAWYDPLRLDYQTNGEFKDWTMAFRIIGEVNAAEASMLAKAIFDAAEWTIAYRDQTTFPSRLRSSDYILRIEAAGKHMDEWLQMASVPDLLSKIALFVERGKFTVEPDRVLEDPSSPHEVVLRHIDC